MQIPKNVIQTGETDPCHKIYMEDYVHISVFTGSGSRKEKFPITLFTARQRRSRAGN